MYSFKCECSSPSNCTSVSLYSTPTCRSSSVKVRTWWDRKQVTLEMSKLSPSCVLLTCCNIVTDAYKFLLTSYTNNLQASHHTPMHSTRTAPLKGRTHCQVIYRLTLWNGWVVSIVRWICVLCNEWSLMLLQFKILVVGWCRCCDICTEALWPYALWPHALWLNVPLN